MHQHLAENCSSVGFTTYKIRPDCYHCMITPRRCQRLRDNNDQARGVDSVSEFSESIRVNDDRSTKEHLRAEKIADYIKRGYIYSRGP